MSVNMSGPLNFEAKVNADIKADATSVMEAGSGLVSIPTKGLAKVCQALVGPWMARRDRTVALIQAQTERDCAEIRSGVKTFQANELLECREFASVVAMYEQLHELNHTADALRLKAAIDVALLKLAHVDPAEISDEQLSQTFFNRWRREAEAIDDEDLRNWWSELLKDEVVQPGRISSRTLDVIKNLSRNECECFRRLCKGAIKNELLVSYDNQPVFGVYEDVLEMQNIGLLSYIPAAAKTRSENRLCDISFKAAKIGIRVHQGGIWMHTFSLTQAGMDLLRVIGEHEIDDGEVSQIREFIEGNRINGADGGEIELVDVSLVENEEWGWVRGHRPACFE